MNQDHGRDDERTVDAWMAALPDMRNADPNEAVRSLRRHVLDRQVRAARWRLAQGAFATVVAAAMLWLAGIGLRQVDRIESPVLAAAPSRVVPLHAEPSEDEPADAVAPSDEPIEAAAPPPPARKPRKRYYRPALASRPTEPTAEPGAKIAGLELASFFTPGFPLSGQGQPSGYVVETAHPESDGNPPVEVVRLLDAETREELVRMVTYLTNGFRTEAPMHPNALEEHSESGPEPAESVIEERQQSSVEEGSIA